MTATNDRLVPYRTAIAPDWIDYNGHLRDAYYGLVFSSAIDDVMDQLGLDAAYRGRTSCTLYTLEVHIHYLHEVNASDELLVRNSILDSDHKRIHARGVFQCARIAEPVAVAEAMLLHVQQGSTPASVPFPPQIEERLRTLREPDARTDAGLPHSRKIEIRRR